ncbi:MAG: hypothetical protein KDD82_18775 [Planctomycetes bacterium]|nr:hypothetical protein [Planctomycetota bacterium]
MVARCVRIGLFALLVSLTGCLEYGEELVLKADGSGSLTLDFTIDLSYLEEVSKALGEQPNEEDFAGPTEEEIREGLKVEGITIKEIKLETKGRKTRVKIALDFANLEALNEIEGFGDDRRILFYDEGEGMVRVVYSFDTTDAIPADELDEEEASDDPVEKKITEVTKRAREAMRFRSRLVLPGAIKKSNGRRDASDPNASVWVIDSKSTPDKHKKLGRGKIRMMALVSRDSLPFVKALRPLPKSAEGEDDEDEGERKR